MLGLKLWKTRRFWTLQSGTKEIDEEGENQLKDFLEKNQNAILQLKKKTIFFS